MNTERWYRIEALFEQAQGLSDAEREGFLDGVCAGDPGLRRELAALLAGSPTWEAQVRGAVIEEIRLLADDDVAARLGSRIGRFRLIRWLGAGGMGDVYLAERDDAQFTQRVAIKFLPHSFGSPSSIARFRDERQILAALEHPNIVRLLDGGSTDDDLPYLVMEYIEGRTITQYAESEQLSVRRRVELVRDVCAALQYAHRHLVVHRDIKPSNVLVDADGAPKILDFGIAKLLTPDLPGEAPTATAMVMTPEYASPEQARGELITTATDVYSLGVVLYELLTGHYPYRLSSRQPLDVLRAVSEQEPECPSDTIQRTEERTAPRDTPPIRVTPESVARTREGTPEKLRRRLRGDLDNILMLALRKQPQRRYASVEAFSDDIRRYLHGLPVQARKPSVGYRAGKFVKRHVAGVAASVAVLALLVGFAVAMALQSAREARERKLAQKERATAQQVSAFLVDLFKVSDPSQARGNTVTAREVLDKGAEKIATDLKDQPEVRATLMDTMGTVYVNLGLYDRAVPLLRGALETRKAVLGPEHLDVAQSVFNLAVLLRRRGDYAAAESLHREALALRRRLLGDQHPDVARSLNNLGLVLADKGDYPGAEAFYREALAMRRKLLGDRHRDVAGTLNNLASVVKQRGDYAEAESLYREALAIVREQLGNEHPDVALSLDNLADVLALKGDFAGAEKLFRETVPMLRKLLGSQHPSVAVSLVNLADMLCLERKPAEAEPIAREALAIFRNALPSGHTYIGEAESVLGGCLTLSERYGEAEPLLLGSYPVLKAKTGERSPETRKARERIVRLYEAWGRPGEAARYRAEMTAENPEGKR
jgi:serine/threonine-protein kinase